MVPSNVDPRVINSRPLYRGFSQDPKIKALKGTEGV